MLARQDGLDDAVGAAAAMTEDRVLGMTVPALAERVVMRRGVGALRRLRN
jgi:hypothetical protein